MADVQIEIPVSDVKRLLDEQAIVLIDCREQDEWETAKIDGAVLMPMSRWMDEAGKLSEYAGRRLVVHCHHGARSAMVTDFLRKSGFDNAWNLAGGIDAWAGLVAPDMPRY